jgi:hypothetical protein
MMKPKTRQEMLRLVESIREKLDLAPTLVALREAGASERRETKGDLLSRPSTRSPRGGSCPRAAPRRQSRPSGRHTARGKPANSDDRWPTARLR